MGYIGRNSILNLSITAMISASNINRIEGLYTSGVRISKGFIKDDFEGASLIYMINVPFSRV